MDLSFLKKYIIFAICSAIVLALMLVAAFKLASSARTFDGEKQALKGAIARLQQLHSRNPYPSLQNVQMESENVNNLLQVYSALSDMLRKGQIDEENMEAADFMPLLEKTLRIMRTQLEGARIILPANFAFGFDQYAGGQLPVPDDIPRLVQQLRIVESFCSILAEAGISELSMISREVFEAGATAPARSTRTGRRGEPVAPSTATSGREPLPDMPYSTQSFKLVFRTREHALFNVLNRLAADPMFITLNSADVASKGQDVRARTTSRPVVRQETVAPASLEATPRDQRVILRKEDLEVSLEVEVYHFQGTVALR